ncbi:hypothetical protein BD770DRAFT_408524 [Pilaira anomala]|nr:hypothetical protein BD770DRAFT_408524 [Pilaira anomala]
MKEIPTRFIISSRLSTLEPKEIIRIVYLAGSQWNEKQVKERMAKYPNRPFMGVGISNPQELSQVIKNDIPVIHIQEDCKALLGVQKRWVRNIKIWNRILNLTSASVWGLFSFKVIHIIQLLKRGDSNVQFPVFERGNLPIPNQNPK